jgi:hypothetical protein
MEIFPGGVTRVADPPAEAQRNADRKVDRREKLKPLKDSTRIGPWPAMVLPG